MEATLHDSLARGRAPLSGLSKLVIGALVGIALILGYLQASMFGIVLPITIFTLAGGRWVPALGALISAALLLMFGPPMLEAFANPLLSGPMFVISAITMP